MRLFAVALVGAVCVGLAAASPASAEAAYVKRSGCQPELEFDASMGAYRINLNGCERDYCDQLGSGMDVECELRLHRCMMLGVPLDECW